MIQAVYLVVVPGAERVYVSTSYPEHFVALDKRSRVFRVDVTLLGVDKVDEILQLTASEITTIPQRREY